MTGDVFARAIRWPPVAMSGPAAIATVIVAAAVVSLVAIASACVAIAVLLSPGRLASDDFEATRQWALDNSREIDSLRGNDIAVREAVREFNAKNVKKAGTKVRWSLPVERVDESAVVLRDVWIELRHSGHVAYLDLRPSVDEPVPGRFAGEKKGRRRLTLAVGRNISRDAAMSLRPGDSVSVRGTIKQVSFVNTGVMVTMVDLAAE